MSDSLQMTSRPELEPLDPKITSIQPGGGICMSIELSWGHLRRWWLKTFRPHYVRRMGAVRICDGTGCPHEVLDPRDLKYYRNQTGDCWRPEDDPFRWRDRLPFVRAGLGELVILTTTCLFLAAIVGYFFWPLAIPFLLAAALVARVIESE